MFIFIFFGVLISLKKFMILFVNNIDDVSRKVYWKKKKLVKRWIYMYGFLWVNIV